MQLILTDVPEKMEMIGREIYREKAAIYTEQIVATIQEKIVRCLGDISDQEKERIFFCSIYDYWVYGVDIAQWLNFHFDKMPMQEKETYITYRNCFRYYDHLNKAEDVYIFENKFETYKKFKPYYKRDMVLLQSEDDYDVFCAFAEKHPAFVVKPVNVYLGVGVHKEEISEGEDRREVFKRLLNQGAELKRDHKWVNSSEVVLEELIIEDESMAYLHPASVNGVRCPAVMVGDEVHIFRPWMRMGTSGHFVSNGGAGGIFAGINAKTGVVETNGFSEHCEEFEYHPDTGVKIKGFQIPRWDECVQMVTEMMKMTPTVRYVGWDMVLTPNGWCAMEGNHTGEFLEQITRGIGEKQEFEELIGWKPDKQFWWE